MSGHTEKVFSGTTTLEEVDKKVKEIMFTIPRLGNVRIDIQKREDGYYAAIYILEGLI